MSVPFFCCLLFVTVSVQYFCPLFFLHQCLLHIFAECCQFTSVSVICFLFTGVHFILLLYVVCCCVTPAFLLSAICFRFASVCSMFCLPPVSVQCFCHLFSLYWCLSMFLPCVAVTVCAQVSALFSVTNVDPMFSSHCYFCRVLRSLF